jgi:hypothetical protein
MSNLDFKINESVLKKTINCNNGFRCLAGNRESLCDVVGSVGSSMVQIKSEFHPHCKYRVPFDSFDYCLCPTRTELYNRYRV